MPIEFKSRLFHQKILDPNQNFEPVLVPLEVRWDTLTGHMAIIQEFRFRGQMPKPDYSSLIKKTLPVCPFCPGAVNRASPKFPPELVSEGWLQHRGVQVIPNFNPYASYSAIAILSSTHFIELTQFTRDILVNGLLASQEYLRRVADHDRRARYMSINWNYLPPAGGSVVHPHLQPTAGYIAPTYEKETLAGLRKYHRKYRTSYWADLVQAEKEKQERFVGETGRIAWLVNFAGRGRDPDLVAIFQERHSILGLAERDFEDFYDGLRRVFGYLADKNYGPFNLALYSGPPGETRFWVHARLKPRFQFPMVGTSDYCFTEALHDDYLCQTYPETVCRELKKYFI